MSTFQGCLSLFQKRKMVLYFVIFVSVILCLFNCLIVFRDMSSVKRKKELDKTIQSEIKAKKISRTFVQLLKK